jgi:hypothetical protein
MSELKNIRPASTAQVRHANGTALDPKGEAVTWSTWWQRRLNDGDIEIVEFEQSAENSGTKKGKTT